MFDSLFLFCFLLSVVFGVPILLLVKIGDKAKKKWYAMSPEEQRKVLSEQEEYEKRMKELKERQAQRRRDDIIDAIDDNRLFMEEYKKTYGRDYYRK